MRVREVIRMLHADGWFEVGQKGSHRHFKHATKPGRVTVAGAPQKRVPPKTLKSILTQAGLGGRE